MVIFTYKSLHSKHVFYHIWNHNITCECFISRMTLSLSHVKFAFTYKTKNFFFTCEFKIHMWFPNVKLRFTCETTTSCEMFHFTCDIIFFTCKVFNHMLSWKRLFHGNFKIHIWFPNVNFKFTYEITTSHVKCLSSHVKD